MLFKALTAAVDPSPLAELLPSRIRRALAPIRRCSRREMSRVSTGRSVAPRAPAPTRTGSKQDRPVGSARALIALAGAAKAITGPTTAATRVAAAKAAAETGRCLPRVMGVLRDRRGGGMRRVWVPGGMKGKGL